MFKFYELISGISCIEKPSKNVSRGFNVAYDIPEENRDFLLLVSSQNFNTNKNKFTCKECGGIFDEEHEYICETCGESVCYWCACHLGRTGGSLTICSECEAIF